MFSEWAGWQKLLKEMLSKQAADIAQWDPALWAVRHLRVTRRAQAVTFFTLIDAVGNVETDWAFETFFDVIER